MASHQPIKKQESQVQTGGSVVGANDVTKTPYFVLEYFIFKIFELLKLK